MFFSCAGVLLNFVAACDGVIYATDGRINIALLAATTCRRHTRGGVWCSACHAAKSSSGVWGWWWFCLLFAAAPFGACDISEGRYAQIDYRLIVFEVLMGEVLLLVNSFLIPWEICDSCMLSTVNSNFNKHCFFYTVLLCLYSTHSPFKIYTALIIVIIQPATAVNMNNLPTSKLNKPGHRF